MRTAGTVLAVLLGAAVGMAAVMDVSSSNKASAEASSTRAAADDGDLWWHHAIFYQIYPRSFKDSKGTGIGDLAGITSKLEYLKDIGVMGVWLSPFYPSPQKDFGYDISDFKNVDPTYGTLDDFQAMTDKAHELGLKVVVDLVPNHSSDQHEWFQKSVRREAPYTDYYVWSDGKMVDGVRQPPNNWVSHFRFSAWTWNEQRQQYYLHQFVKEQPDLNYRNAAVVQEMKDVYTFWMDKGVDGFRVDALPFLFETEDLTQDEPLKANQTDPDLNADDYDFYTHPYTMDYPDTYDMLAQWRTVVDTHPDNKPRVIMTECYTSFDKTIEYYGTKEKPAASFPFNFQFVSNIGKSSSAGDMKSGIDQWMGAMTDGRWPNWVIGNHDNPRAATRFPNLADAMNMISLTLPGTAMTYYGEELGMTDAFIRWDQTKDPSGLNAGEAKYLKFTRDPCRTPMQWDGTTSAGFSTNHTTWMPTNPNYWQLNVEAEQKDPKSHLSVYKDLTAARKTPTLRKGDTSTKVLQDDVLVITRSLAGNDTYITVVNVGSWEKTIAASDLLADAKLSVYTASGSSTLQKGDAMTTVTLRPKMGIVLTTASGAAATHAALVLSLVLAVLCQRL